MTKTMTFDAIEKALGSHCDTAKCVRERVELHKETIRRMEADEPRNRVALLNTNRLPFPQTKG